jgi:hypothetical protein
MKVSTKKCPKCGNTWLLELRTMDMKICVDHVKVVRIPWFLEEGQVLIK